jgi:hypothetical protein
MLNKNLIIIGLAIFLMSTITTSVLPVNALVIVPDEMRR